MPGARLCGMLEEDAAETGPKGALSQALKVRNGMAWGNAPGKADPQDRKP